MMRRNTVARARVIPVPAPAAADPDTISDSGSSTSAPPPPKPGTKQTNSVLQVLRTAGAPVAADDELEMTSHQLVVEGTASAVVSGTAINSYLRTYGQIPMTRSASEGPVDLDHRNALAPPDASRRAPPRLVDRPVICAYCNCAFCFGTYEVPSLDLGPGHVYPAPPAPITLDLLTPPPVGPLYRRRTRRGPAGALPEWLLVCSSDHHFKATMGMLQRRSGGAPSSLVWKCTVSCLRVLPVVVGTEDANSPDLLANPAPPPPEPWRYAGAYWNYVAPGHEDMVKLKLHDDPLKLTLGRR